MRQLRVRGEGGLQRGHRPLRVGEKVGFLLPVGQKGAHRPLRPLISAEKQVAGAAPGVEQIGDGGLLARGEKWGAGGDRAVLGQLQLIQGAGQQHPLLPAAGTFVQQFGLVHGGLLFWWV